MKKKLFFAAVALVMSAATAVGYMAYDKGNMSEFMMANIEALTESEGSGKCFASLACSMVNAPQNTVYCEGEQECHRYPDKRYVECDGVASYCHG